jgi:hypothetical protein
VGLVVATARRSAPDAARAGGATRLSPTFVRPAIVVLRRVTRNAAEAKEMAALATIAKRTLDDLRRGGHREAYALFLIGLTLAVLGITGIAGVAVLLSAMLVALSFLVFHTAIDASDRKPELDQVLHSRQDFGAFSKLLPGVRDLRIFGPTAVNVLVNAADIRRFVLERGGTVRVVVLEDVASGLAQAFMQLDDALDLRRTLQNSISTMERLSSVPGFDYRKLPISLGFSLVIVNQNEPEGYVIFESHGFKDENIADRMHIVTSKRESPRWFSYWVSRFEAIWEAARLVPSPVELSDPDA